MRSLRHLIFVLTLPLIGLLIPGCSDATGTSEDDMTDTMLQSDASGDSQLDADVTVQPDSGGDADAAVQPDSGGDADAGVDATHQVSVWTFDDDAVDAPPSGFSFGLTGSGSPGQWVVQAAGDAPSAPNVLAQIDTDSTDSRFPIAVADEPSLADVSLSVRCKPVSGSVDQACGLVARYQDEDNYYLTRANALEDNIRLYTVVNGSRQQIAGFNGPVEAGTWHDYRLEIRGDHLEVFWNGERVIDVHDTTFTEAGRVGVWTKADSVTYFDDLRAEVP